MNDWALYLGMAALLCAACSLLGAGLAHQLGVDPSRETPGAEKKGAARRLLLGRLSGFVSMLPAALWMSAAIGDVLGRETGAAVCAIYALACALLSFCALFTSVRHGAQGMAHVCGEELFAQADKLRYALGMLAAVLSAGAMLMSLIRDGQVDVSNGLLLAFSLAVWPMLGIGFAADRIAPVLGGEGQMLPCAMGGPVCAALIAMLALLPGATLVLSGKMILTLMAGVQLCWIFAWLALCGMGAEAMHGLTQRPLERRKRSKLPFMIFCVAASVLLALYAGGWLFVAAAALCMLCVLADVCAMAAWIRRIGRGLFSRY
ncbi:MAG: hypothetical protein IJ418_12275 [Clostridia bacterium]|nr:hypothetical protein [Clostridia bacterium]